MITNDLRYKCDICGRFISDKDIETKKAKNITIISRLGHSADKMITLCKKHNNSKNEKLVYNVGSWKKLIK